MVILYILLSAVLLHGFFALVMTERMEIASDEADQRFYDSMKGTLWQEPGPRPEIRPGRLDYREGRYDWTSPYNLVICLLLTGLAWGLALSA